MHQVWRIRPGKSYVRIYEGAEKKVFRIYSSDRAVTLLTKENMSANDVAAVKLHPFSFLDIECDFLKLAIDTMAEQEVHGVYESPM